jgi:protein-disulfide isomerase
VKRRFLARLTAVATALPAVLLVVACGRDDGVSPTNPSAPALTAAQVEQMLVERSVGNAGAPVTVIEYSSLTCPHCATFQANTLPLVRANYIDTGKVRFVHRDFPLDATAQDGAVLARCAGERYYEALDLLYRAQAAWGSSRDPRGGMKAALAPLGMGFTLMDSCLQSTELRNGVTRIRQEGQSQHGVNVTPTFLVNEQKILGALPYPAFAEAIEAALAGKT